MKRTLIIFPTIFEGTVPLKYLNCQRKIKTPIIEKFAIGNNSEKNLCVMISGIRCDNTVKLVDDTASEFKPERVIICGYCGACDPDLKNGNFICDSQDKELNNLLQTFCRRGKIKCSDHIVDRDEKLELFKSGYIGVEMEYDVFANAIKKHSPEATFAHIRCVSDSVESQIPASFFTATFDSRDGTLSTRRIILQLLLHPSLFKKLKHFADETKEAQKIYADKVVKIMEALTK